MALKDGSIAVFLDRDGTLSEEVGYMRDLSMLHVYPWTSRAIRRINEAGMAAVVVTNQSAIGRGYFDRSLVDTVHEQLRAELEADGARLDAIYYCPHHPQEGCDCRKPRPGMLELASREMDLRLDRSFMIGDSYSDVRAGAAAGARTILVLTGHGTQQQEEHRHADLQPDYVAATLEVAVDIILGLEYGGRR